IRLLSSPQQFSRNTRKIVKLLLKRDKTSEFESKIQQIYRTHPLNFAHVVLKEYESATRKRIPEKTTSATAALDFILEEQFQNIARQEPLAINFVPSIFLLETHKKRELSSYFLEIINKCFYSADSAGRIETPIINAASDGLVFLANNYPKHIANAVTDFLQRKTPLEDTVSEIKFFLEHKPRILHENPLLEKLISELYTPVEQRSLTTRLSSLYQQDAILAEKTCRIVTAPKFVALLKTAPLYLQEKLTLAVSELIALEGEEKTTESIAKAHQILTPALLSEDTIAIQQFTYKALAGEEKFPGKTLQNILTLLDTPSIIATPNKILQLLEKYFINPYFSHHPSTYTRALELVSIPNSIQDILSTKQALDTLQLKELSFGSQELVALEIYRQIRLHKKQDTWNPKKASDYSTNAIIPAIQIIEGIHKEKKSAWIGAEIGTPSDHKGVSGTLQFFEDIQTKNQVTRSETFNNLLEVRTQPSWFPVMLNLTDLLFRTNILPKSTYVYHVSYAAEIIPEGVFLLVTSALADNSLTLLSQTENAKNSERMGFPGMYVGTSVAENGQAVASQTNFFDGNYVFTEDLRTRSWKCVEHAIQTHPIKIKLLRYGLICPHATKNDETYHSFKNAVREFLETKTQTTQERNAVESFCSEYKGETQPFDDTKIKKHVREIGSIVERAGQEQFREMVHEAVFGKQVSESETLAGIVQKDYTPIEQRFIELFFARKYRGALNYLKMLSSDTQGGIKNEAEKLLSFTKKQ
ncbi:MAG: hypothetical protein Q7K43_03700, partial [Candidatus Woesearchaeota archaeon]|nr:hypothetical protein [Candidatus Woesearchaeota archaeon]